jgi:hypothetical protein
VRAFGIVGGVLVQDATFPSGTRGFAHLIGTGMTAQAVLLCGRDVDVGRLNDG